MRVHLDVRRLEASRREEYRELHRQVLRLLRSRGRGPARRAGVCWDLGRLFRRITGAELYRAGGHRTFDEYVEARLEVTQRQAARWKAISVFPREVVEEHGVTILDHVLRHWGARPGSEDPAHVRSFRFAIFVRGRLEEHVLGDPELTVERLEDATARLIRERATARSPLAARLARFIARVEREMRSEPEFVVRTEAGKRRTLLQFCGVGDDGLVRFWRAQGAALAATGQIPRGRAAHVARAGRVR